MVSLVWVSTNPYGSSKPLTPCCKKITNYVERYFLSVEKYQTASKQPNIYELQEKNKKSVIQNSLRGITLSHYFLSCTKTQGGDVSDIQTDRHP